MIDLDHAPVESHKNIIRDVLKELEKKKIFKNFYFLLKRNEDIDNEGHFFSLSKLNFRDEPILDLKKKNEKNENGEGQQCNEIGREKKGDEEEEKKGDNEEEKKEGDDEEEKKEGDEEEAGYRDGYKKVENMEEDSESIIEREYFSLIFNDPKTEKKKEKKNFKESELLQKLTNSNVTITDEAILKHAGILLNSKNEEFWGKDKKVNSLQNYYPFYDKLFSKNFYLKQEEGTECYFYLSKQLNNLTIVSLEKYNKILWDILNYIKEISTSKDLKKLMRDYVKVEYDERLVKANISGKRKRNTICINYNMVILQIVFNNKVYKIKSKIQGLLCDVNEQLAVDPALLFSDTQEGWLVILKNTDNKKVDSAHIKTVQQYEEENKSFINEFNTLLNHFE